MKFKIASTQQIREFNETSLVLGRNRAYEHGFLDDVLAEEGVAICTFSMLHEHQGGMQTTPHMRTMWMAPKRFGMGNDPLSIILDVEMDAFEALAEHDTALAMEEQA